MAPRLAYLGLGAMGQAMTKNLILNGKLEHRLILWNRTLQVALDHSARIGHSVVAETVEEAVQGADIIWSCFASQEAVSERFETILQRDVKGKLFVESSTISADATNKLAERVIAAGAEFVAMPVFGEPSMAQRALLTCLPCGREESVQRVLPYTKGVVGRAVVDLSGQKPGTASTLKLVGNTLIVGMIENVAEAHVLAEKAGVEAKCLHQVIENVWPGPYAIYSSRMSSGEYYKDKPIVNVEMAKHVASHVLALAEETGTSLSSYKVAVDHIDDVEKHAGEAGDISGIYGAIRKKSGLPFER
ncbi:MAG: hypothetical protein M1821_007444 [Bathelium mastoideum]|nr:MAG: hypothetical protein M1821_007444 [Bathelium mastoideum]KAI9694947.1 MAG: hypothetical protein M1822_000564 [Bathelium mastoideum]